MSKETEKRKVAIIIPYYFDGEDVHVFLQKRSANTKILPGYFAFFGGGIEEGESPEAAVVREVKEELDIDISNYSHFAHYEFFRHIMDVYIMPVEKNFEQTVNVKEGDYGTFFTEDKVSKEEKMITADKVVLENFFKKIKDENKKAK
jgi:mutator protein MutT